MNVNAELVARIRDLQDRLAKIREELTDTRALLAATEVLIDELRTENRHPLAFVIDGREESDHGTDDGDGWDDGRT